MVVSLDDNNRKLTLGMFEIKKDIELIQTCSNKTDFCDSCNITSVKYPNSTKIISDVAMTKRASDFNYTLESENNIVTGVYIVNGFCDSSTEKEVWAYTFEVTNTGDSLSTATAIIYVIFLVAITLIWLLVVFWSIKIPFRNNKNDSGQLISINDFKYLKIFFIALSYILLMWTIGILRSLSANYLLLSGAGKIFNYLFWIMFSFLWPLMIFALVVGIVVWFDDKKLNKKLKRGLFVT